MAQRPLGRATLLARVFCALLLVAASARVSLRQNAAARARAELGTRALCRAYRGIPEGFASEPSAGMVFVEGGQLTLGSDHGYAEERGGRVVHVASFWIDRTEVSNAQFSAFVAATGYVTYAERAGEAPVFHVPSAAELEARGNYAWWNNVKGANFRHPEGPGSSLVGRENHPVVQITHDDALAYARWLGRSLPSEAQWEYAAKAGRSDDSLHHEPRDARGRPAANFWQGEFPRQNSREDGFLTSAPVGCFGANPLGLFDTLGNVWEWTGSIYTSSQHARDHEDAARAFAGAGVGDATSGPQGACSAAAPRGAKLVLKGGSFLCAASFCARYRVAARHAQEPSQPAMHVGFRTVRSASVAPE